MMTSTIKVSWAPLRRPPAVEDTKDNMKAHT